MTIDDFQIAGILHDATESLKSAVIYSIALDPMLFRWKIMNLSGPKAYSCNNLVRCECHLWHKWFPLNFSRHLSGRTGRGVSAKPWCGELSVEVVDNLPFESRQCDGVVLIWFSVYWLDIPYSLEGYVLWSNVSTNCLHVFLRCSFVVLVISSFICCRVGEVGYLDLRLCRALTLSNISAETGSALIGCRPYDICWDSVARMMVHTIFFSFLAVCWKPTFVQFVLYLLTILGQVCLL